MPLCVALVAGSAIASGGEGDSGKERYEQKCARCHGVVGEGTAEGHEAPLVGELSVAELGEVIAETMPEDAPESCVGDEAMQIAAYIFEAFYSPAAAGRRGMGRPRVELGHLTVAQYRNAVADLLGEFTPAPSANTEASENQTDAAPRAGLMAEYFSSKGMSKADDLKEARTDHAIDFNFGEGAAAGRGRCDAVCRDMERRLEGGRYGVLRVSRAD